MAGTPARSSTGASFPVWSATLHVMMATTTLVLVVLVTVLRIGR